MSPRTCLALGALLAAVGVGMGAFGAHWLRDQVPQWYSDSADQVRMLDTWEVGVRYQMYSALGLVAIGLWGIQAAHRRTTITGVLFLIGVVVFSGLLYLLVVTGQRVLGAIVPIGGVAMILGWAMFAWQVWQDRAKWESDAH